MVLLSTALVLFITASQARPPPAVTYITGPHQLTLISSKFNTYRFAYTTDNQFRAERRHLNGTIEGYYGYIGADGQPVRVKYSSVDDLGFMANSELVDIEFATEIPPEVETEVAPTEDITEQLTVILPNDSVELANKESISVDAAKFVNDLLRTRIYFDRT